ncbi:hypothetical protein GCM10018790_74060 [Kitasatospora xanthocidica]|uniref:hypothetical protein n=1 Tax=Kitasatospora xanthocidica TaxID=83382 RepID=UPI0016747651|nr:hypothetical protein [Kitasatospora xanthocidica]GHF85757.1 hypothetical protein GCM10018790_74060 [Kitasatospora xanthocidica]
MRLRAELHRVHLGRDEYRVITPAWQTDGTCLYASPDGWFMELQVDPQGAGDLATVCALAARSRHSLVHLPLRAGTGPSDPPEDRLDRLDLLLVHHSLGFPASRWKEVRARLGAGTPHTVDLPGTDLPAVEAVDHERRHFAGWRDELRFAGAAHTLVVTGSPTAFRWAGSQLHELAREASGGRPDAHHCLTLTHGGWGSGRPAKGVPGSLHVTCAPGRSVG